MLSGGENAPTDPQVGGPVATPQAGTPGTGTTPGTGGTVAPSGTVGSIILITNITGGQLLVDGAALGDAQHGREVSVIAGSHQVAISQGGTIVAQQNVNVLANVPTQVQLVASAQVPVPTPGVPGAAPEIVITTTAQSE